jgi:hypothetical protein
MIGAPLKASQRLPMSHVFSTAWEIGVIFSTLRNLESD